VRRRHWTTAERPAQGWASLTDTESFIAGLVSRGLTNRQIAGQMFVSPHTVAFHLRQIFRKLSIGSRVELARLAIEQDRGQDRGQANGPHGASPAHRTVRNLTAADVPRAAAPAAAPPAATLQG
jgi:DNA-binding CsgD family transcriptional regulator